MNVLASLKTHTILIALCVFAVLALPGFVLAQTGGPVEGFAQRLSWTLVNSVFGFFVWAGGMILNYAVTNFVAGFGAIYIDGGLGYSVNLLWGIVRDVFNLTFIFGLVFIGFKLILNSGDSSAKRMLGTLIMAALLVNFSLFFTKIVIDFTNLAAAQFAAGFLNGTTYDVSGTFMSLFGLGGLWSTSLSLTPLLVPGQGWTYIFLSMILFLIAAFVFFAGGILLSIRFVVLNIYMILSPIMFLGWVFPGFAGTSREYWSGFLQRAFFAPAYMLMIYLSNQVLVNYQATLPRERLSGIFTDNAARATASFDATVPFFLVASIFLIASLVVAQKMGAQGATTAIAMGKRITGKTKQLATGGAAHIGRKALDKAASTDPKKDGQYGTAMKLLRPMARRTARAANYVGIRDGLEGAAKPWTNMTDSTKKRKAAQAARDSATRQNDTVAAGLFAKDMLAEHMAKHGDSNDPKIKAEREKLERQVDEMAKAVSGMSTKLIEDMSQSQIESIQEYITGSQFENLMKSDNLTDKQKEDLTVSRRKSIQSFLNKSGTVLAGQMNKLSIDQIETMGEDWISDNVGSFSNSQMDDLKKSKKFTDFRRGQFADRRKASVVSVINTGSSSDVAALFKNEKEIGKLPTEAFTSSQTMPYLNPAGLQDKLKNGGFKDNEQDLVRSAIQNYLDNPSTSDSKRAAWKKWAETSTYGAGFGLTVKDRTPKATAGEPSGPKIIIEEGYRTRPKN